MISCQEKWYFRDISSQSANRCVLSEASSHVEGQAPCGISLTIRWTRAAGIAPYGHVDQARPKVFDVLIYLIAHRDRVISRQEILDHLWPSSSSSKRR
jgi:hypothetical protein